MTSTTCVPQFVDFSCLEGCIGLTYSLFPFVEWPTYLLNCHFSLSGIPSASIEPNASMISAAVGSTVTVSCRTAAAAAMTPPPVVCWELSPEIVTGKMAASGRIAVSRGIDNDYRPVVYNGTTRFCTDDETSETTGPTTVLWLRVAEVTVEDGRLIGKCVAENAAWRDSVDWQLNVRQPSELISHLEITKSVQIVQS